MTNPPLPKKLPSDNEPEPRFSARFTGASPDPKIEVRLGTVMDRLYHFSHSKIDLSLSRTYRFLDTLGNPHHRLPPVVHVAGTNGKGSTAAALRALIEASGQTVHTYTSPHLVHPTERIRLAGRPITSEALLDLLTECIEINKGEPITFFELFTCASILAFSRTDADFTILETGMGGRLDTTNVVDAPIATIITNISYDHMAFLGQTLPEIAREKAGIMKPGVPCVISRQFEEATQEGVMDVLLKQSQSLSTEAPLVRFGSEWFCEPDGEQMLFIYKGVQYSLPLPSLQGTHQIWNAGAALAAFRLIAPDHFQPEILSTGLGQIEWPGRLQTLKNHSLQTLVPRSWEITIDGGHNDTGALVLAAQMKKWRAADGKPIHLVVAMVNRRDPKIFLKPLLPFAASLTLTTIEGEESAYTPGQLFESAEAVGFERIFMAENAIEAVKSISAHEDNGAPARILMTGSLYFMGNILGTGSDTLRTSLGW